MPRLFVALDLPSSLKNELSSLCYGVQDVRWVPKENLHLTLRFIGEVPRALYQEIREALHSVDLHPFELKTTTLDVFDGSKGPRTLWIGLEENEDLISLQREIDKKLKILGAPMDKKHFKAHITLGRLSDFFMGDLQPFFDQNFQIQKQTIQVNSFELFSSKLGQHHPQYLIEESYPLD